MRKKILFLFALVSFSVASVPPSTATLPKAEVRLPGGDPVNFTLVDSAGKKVSLSDFRGKFVVIDFWATWCAPCKEELPAMKQLVSDMAGNDKVVFLFISFDQNEDNWKDRVDEDGLSGVHLLAGDEKDKLKEMFNLDGIPHYAWINSKGVIVARNAMHPSDFGVKAALKGYMMKD